jgi:hypothetical protein
MYDKMINVCIEVYATGEKEICIYTYICTSYLKNK